MTRHECIVFDDASSKLSEEFAMQLSSELAASSVVAIEKLVTESAIIHVSQSLIGRISLLDPLVRRLLRELLTNTNEDSSLRLVQVGATDKRLVLNLC